MGASLTVIGPARLPQAISRLMPSEAAKARSAIIARIENTEKVFHLVEEPDIRGWLSGALPPVGIAVEDLREFYEASGQNIGDVHLEVAEWIMQGPRLGLDTAVVFSGRPELCVPPAAAVATLAVAAGIPIASTPHVFALPTNGR